MLSNFALQGKLQVTTLCFTIPNLLILPVLLLLTQVYFDQLPSPSTIGF